MHKAFVMQCVSRLSQSISNVYADCESRGQDFDDHFGAYAVYRGQLYHLGTDHEAAWSAILSPKLQMV